MAARQPQANKRTSKQGIKKQQSELPIKREPLKMLNQDPEEVACTLS